MINENDLAKLENLKCELKKAEIVEAKSISEEKFKEMLDDHLVKVKELLKATENEICFRVYRGVNVALSKQLGDKP